MLLVCLLLPGVLLGQAAPGEILVKGLTLGRVILDVDGELMILSDGQSQRGIRLIQADTRRAILEIGGQRVIMALDQSIARSYSAPEPSARTSANRGLLYRESPADTRQRGRTRVREVRLLEDGDNRITIEVDYFYAGDHAGEARLEVVPLRDGNPVGFVSHAPARLAAGEHVTVVELALQQDAPLVFQSDALRINVAWFEQSRQQGLLANQVIDFNKYWKKVRVR